MASTSAILLDEERLAHECASEWEITSGVFESCRLPGCLLKRTLDCIIHEMTHALFMIHSLTENRHPDGHHDTFWRIMGLAQAKLDTLLDPLGIRVHLGGETTHLVIPPAY